MNVLVSILSAMTSFTGSTRTATQYGPPSLDRKLVSLVEASIEVFARHTADSAPTAKHVNQMVADYCSSRRGEKATDNETKRREPYQGTECLSGDS